MIFGWQKITKITTFTHVMYIHMYIKTMFLFDQRFVKNHTDILSNPKLKFQRIKSMADTADLS